MTVGGCSQHRLVVNNSNPIVLDLASQSLLGPKLSFPKKLKKAFLTANGNAAANESCYAPSRDSFFISSSDESNILHT